MHIISLLGSGSGLPWTPFTDRYELNRRRIWDKDMIIIIVYQKDMQSFIYLHTVYLQFTSNVIVEVWE